MANKIISFSGSTTNFLDAPLSSDIKLVSLPEVFIDINRESSANTDNADSIWKVAKSTNSKAISNSLHNIFNWIPGERILLPEFGSHIRYLLYEGITPLTEERIVAEIRQCVSEWEPRIQIVDIRDVSTIDETEDNTIHLQVIYTIPALSEVEQYSYDFTYNVAE